MILQIPLNQGNRNGLRASGETVTPTHNGHAITVADLAAAKKLPVEFLADLGVRDSPRGVLIPYYGWPDGECVGEKLRTALKATEGSRWPKDTPLAIYGSWRLDEIRKAGFVVLVEGETDCWALWHHGLPALGLPGANTAKTLSFEDIEAFEDIYISWERDKGGVAFVQGVKKRLVELGFCGRVWVIQMPDGLKDPADLHKDNPQRFKERFKEVILLAERQTPGDPVPGPKESVASSEPEWLPPIPLDGVPESPPFPLQAFPEPIQRLVKEGAQALQCPADYLAVPLLVVAGQAIGASRAVAIKEGHVQRAALYAAVIGPPGSAKTPALDLATTPTHEGDEALFQSWEESRKKHAEDMEDYESRLKEWKKDKVGDRPQQPEKPVLRRLAVNDATAESLVPILQENPRGVVLIRDELVGWVQAMNCYREGGKGADQQFWLSAWSGATVVVDRKKTHDQGPLRVAHPFISVVGGLTPDKLPTLRGDRPRQRAEQDGFIDRVLLSYPKEPPATGENWLSIHPDTLKAFHDAIQKLRCLNMMPILEGAQVKGWRPFVITLSTGARQVWEWFTRSNASEINTEGFPQHLRGPWSKLRGYAGRLALILHLLRWACGELQSDDGTTPVDEESMTRAMELVDYFKGHARKVYASMDADSRIADARLVLKWLETKPELQTFSRRDIHQGLRRNTRFSHPDSLNESLKLLEQHGYFRAIQDTTPQKVGRPSLPRYERNPLWEIGTQYPQNPQNPDPTPSIEDFEDIEDVPLGETEDVEEVWEV